MQSRPTKTEDKIEIKINNSRKTSRNWLFTIPNPLNQLEPEKIEKIQMMRWQLEISPAITPHYRGVLIGTVPLRISQLKIMLSITGQYEIIREKKDAIRYVGRNECRIEGPWEYNKVSTEKMYWEKIFANNNIAVKKNQDEKNTIINLVNSSKMSFIELSTKYGVLIDKNVFFTRSVIARRDDQKFDSSKDL
ncbi:hypothetical protein NGRA_0299 [Nosema granulosis]|uniref:Uncharacterized protein n=1 Tax=Nosema granulosis TaxID=83296 RepID=A0A9P6L0P5_9MICR|nr:hypothetical protein NGRA_0299 [Nosema granulosis]